MFCFCTNKLAWLQFRIVSGRWFMRSVFPKQALKSLGELWSHTCTRTSHNGSEKWAERQVKRKSVLRLSHSLWAVWWVRMMSEGVTDWLFIPLLSTVWIMALEVVQASCVLLFFFQFPSSTLSTLPLLGSICICFSVFPLSIYIFSSESKFTHLPGFCSTVLMAMTHTFDS